MASIWRRPLDLVIVAVFVSFAVVAITIDYTQTFYGSVLAEEDIDMGAGVWPPAFVLKGYAWWCENVDTLLAHNPSWYATMAGLSPFLYVPFYLFGIYAFVLEREWIRIPALMWAYGLLLTMVVIIKEQLYGPFPTKDIPMFFAAYGGYALMPVIVMARVARYPVFGTTTETADSSNNKRPKNKPKRN